MIVFELNIVHPGNWDKCLYLQEETHVITKRNNVVPKELIGKCYGYNLIDGWVALVNVLKYSSKDSEYKLLVKRNRGFMGYDWMVESLVQCGKIETPVPISAPDRA